MWGRRNAFKILLKGFPKYPCDKLEKGIQININTDIKNVSCGDRAEWK
jgi:hypothetical protein